ncbi:MAG: hypothetical protein PSX81_15000 [bacterium]|nr:hypothetical protein [bacterium]
MKFSDIYGHADIKAKLINSATSGRVAHAQLFTSKEGALSLPMAIAFAQFLSCTDKQLEDSCGICGSCRKYAILAHPDLHFTFPFFGDAKTSCNDFIAEFRENVIKNPMLSFGDWVDAIHGEGKNLNINILEIRSIFRKLALRAYESEYKILIIWLPEFLKKEGNILLKLVEEPPDNTIFLFVTEQQSEILPTIISRTQVLKIANYSHAEIEQYLLQNELVTDVNIARNIALMAEGNLNRAVKLTGGVESPIFEMFRNWLLNCHSGNMENIFEFTDKLTEGGKDFFKIFLIYGLHIIRATMVSAHQAETNWLTPNENEFVNKLSKFIHIENVQEIYKAFNDSIFETERYGNVKLIYINLSLKLKSSMRPLVKSMATQIN